MQFYLILRKLCVATSLCLYLWYLCCSSTSLEEHISCISFKSPFIRMLFELLKRHICDFNIDQYSEVPVLESLFGPCYVSNFSLRLLQTTIGKVTERERKIATTNKYTHRHRNGRERKTTRVVASWNHCQNNVHDRIVNNNNNNNVDRMAAAAQECGWCWWYRSSMYLH